MTASARERAWAVCLTVARARQEDGYTREFTPETVLEAADRLDTDVSPRTARRALDSMAALGVLRDVSENGSRIYRLDTENSLRSTDDRSGDGPTSSPSDVVNDIRDDATAYHRESDDGFLIYHLFADVGVESEPLSAYGDVVRLGLDPRTNHYSDAVAADATQPPLQPDADLVVCHPMCGRWSPATRAASEPEDWPNQIPDAREVAKDLGDDYIIENVPEAVSAGELRGDVELDGRMFGLDCRYRRAFETSFDVEQPPEREALNDSTDPFGLDDPERSTWKGDRLLWRTAKQVSGDYPSEDMVRAGMPANYIHYIMRAFIRARGVIA